MLTDKGFIPRIILDTKWKSVIINSRFKYNQADIYQMHAYITAYKSAEKCILLYPKTDEEKSFPKWLVPEVVPEKYIEVQQVRLDNLLFTMEDLDNLLL